MLPDFAIPVMWEGRTRHLIACDLPAGVFFYGFPNAVPFAECWERDTAFGQRTTTRTLEAWCTHVLMAAVLAPRLTPELIYRLGPAAEQAQLAYFHAIGWITEQDGYVLPDPPIPVEGALAGPPLARSPELLLRPFVQLPVPTVRQALRMMAERTRTRPAALWAAPISEWIFDWRVLLSDKLLEREARRHRPD